MKAKCTMIDAREGMKAIPSGSVRLMIGPGVYLGKGVDFVPAYRDLYEAVYCNEGSRVLRKDGYLLTIQTNAYDQGRFINKYLGLCELMRDKGWRLLDERVWQRRKADHFQIPFSGVHLWAPPGGTATRRGPSSKSKKWFQGVWDYPQVKGGPHNAYPRGLCEMIVDACTEPGETIVDPFVGTGMLLGVAASMGRTAFGFEIDPACVPLLDANGVEVVQDGRIIATGGGGSKDAPDMFAA